MHEQRQPDESLYSLTPYNIRCLPSVDKNQIVVKKRQRKSVSQLPKMRLTTATLINNEKIKPCQILSNVFIGLYYTNKPCCTTDFVTAYLVVFPRD